jgi:lactate 2-monooxygenase
VPVFFDSGIRCGADIFKAIALGATAAGVGRPYAYGLALAGEEGVRAVMEYLLGRAGYHHGAQWLPFAEDISRDLLG